MCKKGSNIAVIPSDAQQSIILRQKGVENPEPRKQFITDLNLQIVKWNVAREDHLIIMLDANEYQGEEPQGLEALNYKNGLVDIYHDRHIQDKAHDEFPTHLNGSRRIDYILMTNHKTPLVQAIGYTPFYDLFDTDHRSIYCDLSITMFDEIPRQAIHLERLVGTNSRPNEAKQYIETLNLQFNRHHIYKKSTQLLSEATESPTNTEERQKRLEDLDELITHLMLKTETQT